MAIHPAYAAYRTGSAVARALPQRSVRPFSSAVGRLAAATMRDRRRMVARHQRRVRPDLTHRGPDEGGGGTLAPPPPHPGGGVPPPGPPP
ncbi:MAG TPA: hypothetical protein PKE56_17560, partial [Acidimicrobiales bacterium]|nr:hypothetical protein [Acidimicrobiales bacterium]